MGRRTGLHIQKFIKGRMISLLSNGLHLHLLCMYVVVFLGYVFVIAFLIIYSIVYLYILSFAAINKTSRWEFLLEHPHTQSIHAQVGFDKSRPNTGRSGEFQDQTPHSYTVFLHPDKHRKFRGVLAFLLEEETTVSRIQRLEIRRELASNTDASMKVN